MRIVRRSGVSQRLDDLLSSAFNMTSHRQARAGVSPGAIPAQVGNTACKSRTEYPRLTFNVDKFPAFLPRLFPRPSVGDVDGMRPIPFPARGLRP